MNNTWKIIITVIITAIVVGGGVYLWQQNPTNKDNSDSIVLYRDNNYRIEFTTTKACADFYSVKTVPGDMNELENYAVFVPGSKTWPKDSPWYYFSLYTQETYNQFNADELPGKPEMKLRLDSGELLTWWSPQDGPTDAPTCGINIEKL